MRLLHRLATIHILAVDRSTDRSEQAAYAIASAAFKCLTTLVGINHVDFPCSSFILNIWVSFDEKLVTKNVCLALEIL